MSVQMILGASGTGKSKYIYEKITAEAEANRDKRYFIVVPDQFTMQTQMDMVAMSSGGGIMNIDVLSFSRLAHRIFEETNSVQKMVLDDTGKSLILRRLASQESEFVPYLASNMKRTGFIHEVKSSISEFMQYGIGVDELDELIKYSENKGALKAKLSDLRHMYGKFLSYIKDSYITTEESMDLLARKLHDSKIIKDSIVVFDGFTGFTPVQMRVLGVLMQLCEKVYITLTIEPDKKRCVDKMQELFAFTAKSYSSILKLAKQLKISCEADIELHTNYRFIGKDDLAHLERFIFRYPSKSYGGKTVDNISMLEAADVMGEVKYAARQIRELVSNGVQYRDIAVVTGSMDSYEKHIERIFGQYEIPLYLDKTHAIVLNPFVEYTKSMLKMINSNYDIMSVFRFLRSGFGGFDIDEVDFFENYCKKRGIKGVRKYENYINDEDADTEIRVNKMREQLIESIAPICDAGIKRTGCYEVKQYVEALYQCYIRNDAYNNLKQYETFFEEKGEFEKAKEYAQIYRLTMEVMEQLHSLLGDEKISLEEFIEILESGFDEITVGTIPQSVDRVIVGDMERSRLKPVKYLFFLGLNDGSIPKKGGKCSIISDMEREFLAGSEYELAPTPRQKMYIQRFYLYNNLVKPSEGLFMSYSKMDNQGKSLRPAYIVPMLQNMFPNMELKRSKTEESLEDIGNIDELKDYICSLIRVYGESGCNAKQKQELMSAIDVLLSVNDEKNGVKTFLEMLIENSFFSYTDEKLSAKIAGILYGENLLASISRMEKFANCAYAYFLRYGLSLKEREEYSVDTRDLGTIFHDVLERYGKKVKQQGISWFDIDSEHAKVILDEALEESASTYGQILFDGKANQYIYKRMSKVLYKAVDTLTYQLKAGEYNVSELEVAFKHYETLDEVNVALDEQEKMIINGRIDRIDTMEKGDKVYVKIIDYKTGNRDFSLLNFYHGLQLQLVVYLSEGMKTIKSKPEYKNKDIVPGALLYYRVADTTVDADGATDEESINRKIHEALRTKGLLNEAMENVVGLAGITDGKSDVVPVGFKKDGSYTAASSTVTFDVLKVLQDYAGYKLRQIGNQIITGHIAKNPIKEDENKNSCTYCEYRAVCGFEERLEGYNMKRLEKCDDDILIAKMSDEMEAEINGDN